MRTVLFNTWDPRNVNVVLYEERFEKHIRYRHPGISGEAIRAAIENPDAITYDSQDPLVELYYHKGFKFDAESPAYVLKVCVRFTSDVGTVRTAYATDGPKRTEKIAWPIR